MNVNDNSDQAGAGSQRPEEQDEQRDGGSAGQVAGRGGGDGGAYRLH